MMARRADSGARGDAPTERHLPIESRRGTRPPSTPSPRPRIAQILYKELNRGDRGSDYYAATLIGLFVS